jgi:hypothetical protein
MADTKLDTLNTELINDRVIRGQRIFETVADRSMKQPETSMETL